MKLIGGDCSGKDKARSLVTKMANALTAASEIGGPMAAMYLLEHLDHYIDHKFQACFWRGYVLEIMRAWQDSRDISQECWSFARLIPIEFEHLNVYNWVRSGDHLEGEEPKIAGSSDDEISDNKEATCYGGGKLKPAISDDDSEVRVTVEHHTKANTPSYFELPAKHPQARTHERTHEFTKQEQEVMKFFHVKLECNDARDDFSAQWKQAKRGGTNPMYMSNGDMDEINAQAIVFDPANREDDIVNAED
ncbi:hypothetical protein C8Q80DRAFT_1122956 [Daedaleopsis nitida]|nr:hypothetical protein C8Q80DRAFT_1122956 [Daedaleopsis nitida]